MMTFPKTRVTAFFIQYNAGKYPHQRLGQAFYTFMELHKVTSEKEWCDRLFNASSEDSSKMINSRMDHNA